MPSTLGIVASGFDFSPSYLSPALWLDASDTTTITASSGSVSQWDDKSGNARNFTQGTGAVQPTTGASTINGLNVLDFSADYLTSTTTNDWVFLHNASAVYFVAAVAKFGTTANPNAAYGLIGNNAASQANRGLNLRFDDRSSASYNDRIFPYVSNGNAAQFVANGLSANDFMPANTNAVFTMLVDAGNATAADRIKMFRNAGSVIATNTATSTASASNPTIALQVGAVGSNNFPLTGQIAEIVIVSGANATETNRTLVRDYLNAKWGVY